MSDENTDTDTDAEEMHPAVLLLLARMESNPQEFKLPFHEAHSSVWKFFNKAEKAAVSAADRELTMTNFHQSLMDRILKANDPDEGAVNVAPSGTYSALDTFMKQQGMAQQQLAPGIYQRASNSGSAQLHGMSPNIPAYNSTIPAYNSAIQLTQKGKP